MSDPSDLQLVVPNMAPAVTISQAGKARVETGTSSFFLRREYGSHTYPLCSSHWPEPNHMDCFSLECPPKAHVLKASGTIGRWWKLEEVAPRRKSWVTGGRDLKEDFVIPSTIS
jgi:hypothetical protein